MPKDGGREWSSENINVESIKAVMMIDMVLHVLNKYRSILHAYFHPSLPRASTQIKNFVLINILTLFSNTQKSL